MTRDELKARLGKGPFILDGATGTELFKAGLPQGELPEQWVLLHPEAMGKISSEYSAAGSDAVYSCTFGANRINLAKHGKGEMAESMIQGLVRLAFDAVRPGKLVFGSAGPIGELLEPVGDLPEDDARSAFREQLGAIFKAGVDALVLETHTSLAEAVIAVEEARATGPIAVLATMSFEGGDKGYRTMMGDTPEKAAEALLRAGADAVGVNCGRGGADALEVVRRMAAAHPGVPLVAKPNAGLPVPSAGKLVYPTTPEQFGEEGLRLREAGASILGGCCGSTPAHIAALAKALKA